jgi:hypothetical protein
VIFYLLLSFDFSGSQKRRPGTPGFCGGRSPVIFAGVIFTQGLKNVKFSVH